MKSRANWLIRISAIAGLARMAAPTYADPVDLKPYRAAYSVEWHGITIGTASLELQADAAGRYRYVNTNTARGIFRIVLPDPIRQVSTFELVDGRVRPLSFQGTDEKKRPTSLTFDWLTGHVTGTSKGHAVDISVPAGAQDPLSLQIASLRGLAANTLSESVWMVDSDELKEYVLTQEYHAQIDTRLGKLDTLVYSSKGRSSDRITRTWVAPALGYLPVKAERVRGETVEFTLKIESTDL